MALTYTAIATVTVGSGGAANIEFTSIPGTYTDLVVKASLRSNWAGLRDQVSIEFNGSNSNKSQIYLYGIPTVATGSGSDTNLVGGYFTGSTGTSNTFGSNEIYIPNYAGSNNKSFSADGVSETNASDAGAMLVAGLWSSSAAITSIKLTSLNSGNFAQYSTATLYGIKNTV